MKIVCDGCGLEFERRISEYNRNIKLGRGNYHSRSCAGKYLIDNIPVEKRHNVDHLPKGSIKDVFSPFRYYLRKARNRDINCNLTLEYIKDLWDSQKGCCAYTNIPMELKVGCKTPLDASLDRKDSSIGYMKGNVQFVCCSINYAKSDFTDAQMRVFIESIRSQKCCRG